MAPGSVLVVGGCVDVGVRVAYINRCIQDGLAKVCMVERRSLPKSIAAVAFAHDMGGSVDRESIRRAELQKLRRRAGGY